MNQMTQTDTLGYQLAQVFYICLILDKMVYNLS